MDGVKWKLQSRVLTCLTLRKYYKEMFLIMSCSIRQGHFCSYKYFFHLTLCCRTRLIIQWDFLTPYIQRSTSPFPFYTMECFHQSLFYNGSPSVMNEGVKLWAAPPIALWIYAANSQRNKELFSTFNYSHSQHITISCDTNYQNGRFNSHSQRTDYCCGAKGDI